MPNHDNLKFKFINKINLVFNFSIRFTDKVITLISIIINTRSIK